MKLRRLATMLLVLFLTLSVALLVLTWPRWQVSGPPVIALAISVVLISRDRAIGFGIGQIGIFLLFLRGVALVIGDAEEPTLGYIAMPRYTWLGIECAIFVALAWFLEDAKSRMKRGDVF